MILKAQEWQNRREYNRSPRGRPSLLPNFKCAGFALKTGFESYQA
jgi:hypothetical protein